MSDTNPLQTENSLDCVKHRIRPGDVLYEPPASENPAIESETEEEEEEGVEEVGDVEPLLHTVIDLFNEGDSGAMVSASGSLTGQQFIERQTIIQRLADHQYYHWKLLSKEETNIRDQDGVKGYCFFVFSADMPILLNETTLVGFGEVDPYGFTDPTDIDEWGVFNPLETDHRAFFWKLTQFIRQNDRLQDQLFHTFKSAVEEGMRRKDE